MNRNDEQRYRGLSPFELKNKLVELARHRGERLMLNAGRGNPNWVALEPRAAFFLLGQFAVSESTHCAVGTGLGGLPRKQGIAQRLQAFLAWHPGNDGNQLLADGIRHARDSRGIDPDHLVGEWVDGILGDHYPLPVRMLRHAEQLVRTHLIEVLFAGDTEAGRFDLFAVEGASAGIVYVLQSLIHSALLTPGDCIALGTPVFTPYLELPGLAEYRFDAVEIRQSETAGWRYPASELDKLRDPRVKALLIVNPSNPTAVAMDDDAMARLVNILRERPDLIVITDDVYAPFVAGFRSIAAAAPLQTLLLYSFSKFWGATGLRLGLVGLHESNRLDVRLAAMPDAIRARAQYRYRSVSTDPGSMKLIDRMVADSRAVGLNHTAGLSASQQVQMSLFALDGLLDTAGGRQQTTRAVVRRRHENLCRGAGLPLALPPLSTAYYATVDVPEIARTRYGSAFAQWLVTTHEPIDFVVRLAEERGVVLLDGGGFDAPAMSLRISLANLPDAAYEPIGHEIIGLLDDYHQAWRTRSLQT